MRSPLMAAAMLLAVGVVGTVGASSAAAADDPPFAQYQEMHANCTVTHRLDDDPIVFPGLAGASHNHTFIANPTVNANSTPQSLLGDTTSCEDTKDASGYWFPTLLQNGTPVAPSKPTVYYKSGVEDYRTVKPFPAGFRVVVGDLNTPSAADFKGYWTCGGQRYTDIPASCPAGTSLVVRLKAPSCWDGVNVDTANHKSHLDYPVNGVCPAHHPVAVPMLEIKVPYPLATGSTAGLRYSSGAGYSFHYDFMNGWDQTRLTQLVAHCINGGRQCDGYGVDPHKP